MRLRHIWLDPLRQPLDPIKEARTIPLVYLEQMPLWHGIWALRANQGGDVPDGQLGYHGASGSWDDDADKASRASTATGVGGIYVDAVSETAKGAKFVPAVANLKLVGYGAIGVSVGADYYLNHTTNPATGQPYLSSDRFFANTSVTGTALIMGGPPGIFIETSWATFNVSYDYIDSHYPHAFDMNANPALWKY